jgi:hypothetical protein
VAFVEVTVRDEPHDTFRTRSSSRPLLYELQTPVALAPRKTPPASLEDRLTSTSCELGSTATEVTGTPEGRPREALCQVVPASALK